MAGKTWFYCDTASGEEELNGPVSLSKLARLIRDGHLPDEVLVSETGADFEPADRLLPLLEAIPLDRERLMREYIGYGEAPLGEEDWGWASDRMQSFLEALPELAWSLTAEMIDRASSEAALEFLAAGPLEDLLSKDGPDFIDRVESRAHDSAKFRRALGMLRRLRMTDEVWLRVRVAALGR